MSGLSVMSAASFNAAAAPRRTALIAGLRQGGDAYDGAPSTRSVAPFVLTQILLPKLRASSGRVVQVASDAHRRVSELSLPEDLLRKDTFTGRESSLLDAQSKLLGVLFTKALARRLAGTGVTANSCCPGLNVTGLGRESRVFSALAFLLRAVGAFSPEQGARIVVKLASDSGLSSTNGAHFSHGGDLRPDTALVRDVEMQERMWAATAALPAVSRLGLAT